MLKKIVILIVVVIAGILLWAATKPDTLHVERTVTIDAPPDRIFPLINDLHQWQSWSPYEKKDPAMKRTYSGPPSGRGAAYAWDGNRQVGTGRMEVTESTAPSKITMQLEFIKPFEGHDVAEFTLKPNGNSTTVTWSMTGPNRYLGKLMSVFVNMDKMIGSDFEAGLAGLKAKAEQVQRERV
jgi:uncharacterized protein YndB with AHSA1/START domain